MAGVQIPVLPPTCCVTLGKLRNLSETAGGDSFIRLLRGTGDFWCLGDTRCGAWAWASENSICVLIAVLPRNVVVVDNDDGEPLKSFSQGAVMSDFFLFLSFFVLEDAFDTQVKMHKVGIPTGVQETS